MQIIVNHVTRMRGSRVCVAGIDAETFDHVRPTTRQGDPITRKLLREQGGPFGIGALVDLGPVMPRPTVPESEDHRFVTWRARHIEDLSDNEYLAILHEVCVASLADAFGPDLERVSERKYAVNVGHGKRSLAVLEPHGRPRLRVNPWHKLELELRSPDTACTLPITDVRFYENDQTTITTGVVTDVNRRLSRGVDALIMLGLGHAWSASGDEPPRHWLQANGLCLTDRAVGNLP